MSPVPLTDDEWEDINVTLPNVTAVCDKIRTWPFMEFIIALNVDEVSRVRLSQVCFRDAANFLTNARYALG